MRRRDLSTALIASAAGAALTSAPAKSQSSSAPFYPRTEAEASAGVTPTNYREPPGHPRRHGAAVDGRTSALPALAALNSTREQVYLTRGTYLIDSNLSIPNAVWCEHGAVFKVASGVTLSITGPFDGSKSRHFLLEGTGRVEFGAAPNQWPNAAVVPLCPEYWGAVSARAGDSTAAVQACVDSNRDVRFYQDYSVSQIVLSGNELHIDFGGFSLIGNTRTPLPSVLDIKCGFSTLRDVKVDAAFNPLYQCAIHWYTHDLAQHYPGFNRIYGLWPRNALLGLCVGALPGQRLPVASQSTSVSAGNAIDAPLSESTIFGFQSVSCVRGVWMSQPNGKIGMVGATIIGSHAGWSSYGNSGYSAASTCALIIENAPGQFSELHLSGGSIEQNSEQRGQFVLLQNAHLYCSGTILEAVCGCYFAGQVGVSLRDCMNFGFNFPIPYTPFMVAPGCVGWMNISGGNLNFPAGQFTGGTLPLVKGASSFAGDFAVNPGRFVVRFDRVELEDIPFHGSPAYIPLCQGVGFAVRECLLSSYSAASRIRCVQLDEGASLLDGQLDVSNHAIAAFAASGNGASGGWTFAVSNRACRWGSEAAGLAVEGQVLSRALRLASVARQTASATSPLLNVRPERTYLLRGWIKTAGQSGGKVQIRASNVRFDGAASTIAPHLDFINVADTQFTGFFQQLAAYITVPADTARMQLEISASGGADIALCDLDVR